MSAAGRSSIRRWQLVESFRAGFICGADPRRDRRRLLTRGEFREQLEAAFDEGLTAGCRAMAVGLNAFRDDLATEDPNTVTCWGHSGGDGYGLAIRETAQR